MGKFDFDVSDDFLKMIRNLENPDNVMKKMVDEGVIIYEKGLQGACAAHVVTGAMASSIKRTKAKKVSNGWYAIARPVGKDAKGVRNMEKLAYLEFGSKKQRATPIVAAVKASNETAVVERMQKVFDSEVDR